MIREEVCSSVEDIELYIENPGESATYINCIVQYKFDKYKPMETIVIGKRVAIRDFINRLSNSIKFRQSMLKDVQGDYQELSSLVRYMPVSQSNPGKILGFQKFIHEPVIGATYRIDEKFYNLTEKKIKLYTELIHSGIGFQITSVLNIDEVYLKSTRYIVVKLADRVEVYDTNVHRQVNNSKVLAKAKLAGII